MVPMTSEEPTLTKAHGAVMATRPARQPLMVMPRSGLPSHSHDSMVALMVAAAAAVLVVTATWAMATGSAAMVDPGLNPNQPNQSTRAPMVAMDRL